MTQQPSMWSASVGTTRPTRPMRNGCKKPTKQTNSDSIGSTATLSMTGYAIASTTTTTQRSFRRNQATKQSQSSAWRLPQSWNAPSCRSSTYTASKHSPATPLHSERCRRSSYSFLLPGQEAPLSTVPSKMLDSMSIGELQSSAADHQTISPPLYPSPPLPLSGT